MTVDVARLLHMARSVCLAEPSSKDFEERLEQLRAFLDEIPEEPTPEILDKARKLQALAMDRAAAPNERQNAWNAFGEIWKRYRLPTDFGLERDR